MADYINKETGSQVSVADDLVLGPEWELVSAKAKKEAPVKPAAEKAPVKKSKDSDSEESK